MNIETVIELIQSLESAGELSIKETKVMALAKAYQQLAAENVTARNAVQVFCDVVGANTDAICEEVGPEGVRAILAAMSATGNMPATDRIYAGIKADGVEEFAEKLRIPGDDPFMDAVADGVAGAADSYAKQLREGAK